MNNEDFEKIIENSETAVLKNEDGIAFMKFFDDRYNFGGMNITVYIDKDKVVVYDDDENELIYEDYITKSVRDEEVM